eukprot:TRINITY_DN66723_c6_g4_i1.p1 TRINITY_DN66723_c6_g4~~TRINITY_DN66723_c6_g4_i1.p1  ORF type:complete len:141 (-),score=15.28 TRINITY_DN66723_c6_g4_i1:84-506(-)
MDSVGVCKVSDLGLTRNIDTLALNTTTGHIVGTIAYTPPEALTHSKPSMPGDIWMMGLVVLHMYTGNPPWRGLSPAQVLCALAGATVHIGEEEPKTKVRQAATTIGGRMYYHELSDVTDRISCATVYVSTQQIGGAQQSC